MCLATALARAGLAFPVKSFIWFTRLLRSFFKFFLGPTLFHLDGGPFQRKRPGRNILTDAGSRPDNSMGPDLDRSNEVDIRADESLILNKGGRLLDPIIVAGDGAGADVNIFSQSCITQVGEVIDLGSFPDFGVFDLRKIPQMNPTAHHTLGTNARVRTHLGLGLNHRRVRKTAFKTYVVFYFGVLNISPWTNLAPRANPAFSNDKTLRPDHGIRLD